MSLNWVILCRLVREICPMSDRHSLGELRILTSEVDLSRNATILVTYTNLPDLEDAKK